MMMLPIVDFILGVVLLIHGTVSCRRSNFIAVHAINSNLRHDKYHFVAIFAMMGLMIGQTWLSFQYIYAFSQEDVQCLSSAKDTLMHDVYLQASRFLRAWNELPNSLLVAVTVVVLSYLSMRMLCFYASWNVCGPKRVENKLAISGLCAKCGASLIILVLMWKGLTLLLSMTPEYFCSYASEHLIGIDRKADIHQSINIFTMASRRLLLLNQFPVLLAAIVSDVVGLYFVITAPGLRLLYQPPATNHQNPV